MKKSTTKANSLKHKNQLGYIDPSVAGIDIGDKLIYVSIPDGKGNSIVEEFKTTTPELHGIVKKLKKANVTTAVMEATGVYWIPLFEIIEESGGIKPILVDAKSVKNVPGRKTDVQDCQWIQTLYSNGLLRAAFRPPRDRIKLRSYVRHRFNVIKTKQRSLLCMEKSLQLMNIKLSSALSDIGGISGMTIIRAIVAGEKNPLNLAKLRRRECKQPVETFIAALTGNFQEEHIFALKQALELYDFAEKQLEECDKKILAELESYPNKVDTPPPNRDKDKKKNGKYAAAKKPKKNNISFDIRTILWKKSGIDLTALMGVDASHALTIFAEIGGSVSTWENSKKFASWLKVCSGNNISGGKRRKSKKQPCANYVTQTLRMAALSAKSSNSYLGAHIRRISGRADKPRGIKAGAHKLGDQVYYMFKYGWQYHEKGESYYEKAHEERTLKNLKRRARELGFELKPIQKAA
jgi:hypothetical protein